MKQSLRLVSAGALLAAGLPMVAHAESAFTTTTGNGAITATARVDFTVVIPKFVFLQVGSGAAFVNNNTIDNITFDFSAVPQSVGGGVQIAPTGGNLGAGKVTVGVRGNNGNMTLGATSATPLGLTNTTSDTIAWTEITAVAANGAPAHPVVNGGTVTLTATNKVVNIAGDWTYAYANTDVVAPGNYTGRITYTATTP